MWNDKESAVDFLGHRRIAQTITSLIDEQHLRPLTIGVYGDWGAGKSSVLSFIEQQFAKDSDVLVITFNSWLFQGYEDTKSALMESVVTELVRNQPNNQKALRLAKSLLDKINWFKIAKVGAAGMMSLAATAAASHIAPEMAPIVAGHGALSFLSGLFAPKPEKKDGDKDKEKEINYEDFIRDEAGGTMPGQFQQFRQQFRELIQTASVSKLVVLVDDLDRCLPQTVIEILEAIRLFLFVEGTTFVLSADEHLIEYAVRKHFPDLPVDRTEYTRNYLEKLVQIPFRLPLLNRLQSSNYISFLLLQQHLQTETDTLERIVEAFEASKKTPFDNVALDSALIEDTLGSGEVPKLRATLAIAGQLGNVLADGLKGNPRNIKRFLNTLFLRQRVARISGITDSVELSVLAKLMILERFHEPLYQAITEQALSNEQGHSVLILEAEARAKEAEAEAGGGGGKKADKKATKGEEVDKELLAWAKLKPWVGELDLRPYIFISSEKTIAFGFEQEMPKHVAVVLEQLMAGDRLLLAAAVPQLPALKPNEVKLLATRLLSELRVNTTWTKSPPALDGLFKLNEVHSEEARELELAATLESISPAEIRPWATFKLEEFTTVGGRAKAAAIRQQWSASPDIKPGVKQLLLRRSK
ncbi:Qat anti-phage system ATPase QatA [Hymenobacter sp. B1770]|uniref:Qat anti-phage system ATPase QatA n=1 Tax=Hymenobacter sp. B1770 TaxID=1718788 RepID=UPI003CE74384